MRASVVIPTRNRPVELRLALESALRQTVPVEILVMDDGGAPATAEMVRRDFPHARYYHLAAGQGPCFQRNRGIERASAPFVFPIDDDSIFASPDIVERTLADFQFDRAGAVAIPYVNIRLDPAVHQQPPDTRQVYVTAAFVGAAHALRRDLFLALGGYREHLFYMGEEGDFCVRMLAAGHVTRLGTAPPIHHLESPVRDLARADYLGRRNDVLFAWHNVPMPGLLAYWLATTFNGLRFGLRARRPARMARGLYGGYRDCLRHWNGRQPLDPGVCRLFRDLKRGGPVPWDAVAARLPALSRSSASGPGGPA